MYNSTLTNSTTLNHNYYLNLECENILPLMFYTWSIKSIIVTMDLLNTKLLLLAFLFICKSESQEDCPDLALEEIPTAYATDIMMNIQFGDGDGDDPVGRTISIYEAADSNQLKSYMTFFEGKTNIKIKNTSVLTFIFQRRTCIFTMKLYQEW